MTLPLELVSRFEQHLAGAVESLLTHSLRVPGNPEGYKVFREGSIQATLSTNPRALWATQTYGISGQPADTVRRVVEFFNLHGVPARVRIVPGAFAPEMADTLSGLGLRHVGFHTILSSPLPMTAESRPHISISGKCRPRRRWMRTSTSSSAPPASRRTSSTAFALSGRRGSSHRAGGSISPVDGRPAAQAVLHWREDIAYLESAGTVTAFRRRGLQRALIRRRIADATKLGCRVIIGGVDFESESRTNQIACGLTVAYLAAVWAQRPSSLTVAGSS
jgi:ribosomal protein S18 acetylase RimI-like enzyme